MAIIYKPLPTNWTAIELPGSLVVHGNNRYALLVNSVDFPNPVASIWKTINYGDTWAEMDSASRIVLTLSTVSTVCPGVIATDLDHIHVVWLDLSTNVPACPGQSFSMVTDTWDSFWGGSIGASYSGLTSPPALAVDSLTAITRFIPATGIFSVLSNTEAVDHTGLPFPPPPTGDNYLGRMVYASVTPGGAWSGGPIEPMTPADQTIGFGFPVQTGYCANCVGFGPSTFYTMVCAKNDTTTNNIDVAQTCQGFPGFPEPITIGELRMMMVTNGSLASGFGCFNAYVANLFPYGYQVHGSAGPNAIFLWYDGTDVYEEVVADGVIPTGTGNLLLSSPSFFLPCPTGLGNSTLYYVFYIDGASGDFLYVLNDGVSWSAPALSSSLIPPLFQAPVSVLPVGYDTGYIALAFDSYYDKENTAALDIIGGDPFGGPAVFPGGKVVLVGSPTGTPPQPTPGGWPVWPPHWQAENDYDRCLLVNKRAVRKFRWQDQTRCIVWHDMDELGRMPDGGLEFYERGSIVTPAPAPTDTVVMEFTVPTGYLGIIYGVLFHYTGTGFEDGGGDIVWRMKVGNGWAAQGLGNCLFQLGTVGQCLSLTDYIAVNSNQRVQALVQVPNLSGNIQVGASRILATIQGWYYPL